MKPSSTSSALVPQRTISRVTHEMLGFDDPSICRGSPICNVLRHGSAIFANSAGSAETYNLSQEVEQLAYFLSHNWSVPAFTKYLIILLHENLALAVMCAHIAACCIFVLGVFRCLPPIIIVPDGIRSIYCSTVSSALFYLMLFFGHHVRRVIFFKQSYIFLDKICIHQTDKILQSKGILKLGAFLHVSQAMLVVKGEAYFRKLWTVYEFATYTISAANLGKKCRINIIATATPWVLLASVGLVFIANIYFTFMGDSSTPASEELNTWSKQLELSTFSTGVQFPFCACVVFFARKLARDRLATIQELKGFSVEHASCFVESDRALVQRNIATFMDYAGFVSEGSTRTEHGEQEALRKFDSIVQNNCKQMLNACMGKQDMSFLMTQACCMGPLHHGVDIAVDRCSQGVSFQYALFIFQHYAFSVLCLTEFALSASMLAYQLPHLNGWPERAWLLAITAATLLQYRTLRAINFALSQFTLSMPWVWLLVATCWLVLIARQFLAFREVPTGFDFGNVHKSDYEYAEVEELDPAELDQVLLPGQAEVPANSGLQAASSSHCPNAPLDG